MAELILFIFQTTLLNAVIRMAANISHLCVAEKLSKTWQKLLNDGRINWLKDGHGQKLNMTYFVSRTNFLEKQIIPQETKKSGNKLKIF